MSKGNKERDVILDFYIIIREEDICPVINRFVRTTHFVKSRLTLPEHMSSPPDFSGIRVTRSLL